MRSNRIRTDLTQSITEKKIERIFAETYVGVELPHEAGEIVVLEVFREQISGELGRTPDDEGRSVVVPGNHVVDRRIVYELVRLREEGSGKRSVSVRSRRFAVLLHRRRSHGRRSIHLFFAGKNQALVVKIEDRIRNPRSERMENEE